MKFFVYLVLDEFGGEVAGKARRELSTIASRTNERHLYVWCGLGQPPSASDYWSDRFPQWDDHLTWPDSIPLAMKDWDLDRGAVASGVVSFSATPTFRDKLRGWLVDLPKKLVGAHEPYQSIIIITGSLAEPTTGAVLMGLLAAAARFRRIGGLAAPIYGVVGIGLLGGPLCHEEEKGRALIARAMLDLGEFFTSNIAHESAAPIYWVGDAPADGGESGRAEQVTTAAMTILGLTRSIAMPCTLPVTATDPFFFRVDEAQAVQFCNRQFDPDRPFSVAGAYAVSCPAEPLARLLSARVAAVCFEQLSEQAGCAGLEDAGKLDLPVGLKEYLEDVEARAIGFLWDRVAEKTKIPWSAEKAPRQPAWYDIDRVRMLYGRLFEQKDWEHVMDCYGEARLRGLPLDVWASALDEMTSLIEQGVLVRRKQQISLLTRRILLSFLEAVEQGVESVFSQTFRDPVLNDPHRAAQALLGQIRNHLEGEQRKLEQVEAQGRPTAQDPAELRRLSQEAHDEFTKELASVPSPAAVIMRAMPLFSGCLGLPLVLPFDLGVLNPALLRLVAGAILGVGAGGWFLIRHLNGVRRQILGKARRWMERYKAVLEFEDRIARDRAYRELLDSMMACLEWFYSGESPEPPVPPSYHPLLKHQESDSLQQTDLLRPQTVLTDFQLYLRAAARSFRYAEARFLEDFQVSRRETALPEISVADFAGIDQEMARLGVADRKVAPEWMRSTNSVLESTAGADWLVPFRTNQKHGFDHLWRAGFLLPSPTDLLNDQTRQSSSGFQFFDTLRRHILERFREGFALSTRLTEYLNSHPGQVMASTNLAHRYSSLAVPSAVTDGPPPFLFILASGVDDSLAAGLQWSNDMGADHISVHLQLRNFLSAEDLIFYPNETSPSQPLGRAWKAYLDKPWPGSVFLAGKLPKESV